jgi:hypothetical protein
MKMAMAVVMATDDPFYFVPVSHYVQGIIPLSWKIVQH